MRSSSSTAISAGAALTPDFRLLGARPGIEVNGTVPVRSSSSMAGDVLRRRGDVRRVPVLPLVFVALEVFEAREDSEVIDANDAFDDIDCKGGRGLALEAVVRRGCCCDGCIPSGALGGDDAVKSSESMALVSADVKAGGGGIGA